ncbi:hypothetical protein Aduo_011065 [Ancylostoma duodenale]
MPTILKALLSAGWFYTLATWIWGCITLNIVLNHVGWSYDHTKEGAALISNVEWYLCVLMLAITYLSYVVIVLLLTAKKKLMTKKSHRQEISIFLQASFILLYMTVIVVTWHHAGSWLEETKTIDAIVHSIWILYSYCNPILLLALNRTFRTKVLHTIRRRRKSVGGTVVFASTKTSCRTL